MSKSNRFFLAAVCLMACGVSTVFGGALDRFLQEVSFAEKGQGVSNALAMVEARLEKDGLGKDDRAHLVGKQIELLVKSSMVPDSSDEEHDLYERAISIADKDIMPVRGLEPALKLQILDTLAAGPVSKTSSSPYDYFLICLCEKALRDPAVRKNKAVSAGFYRHMADRHYARRSKDLALGCYREAASREPDPVKKAELFFRGAVTARELRDLPASDECLDQIAKIKDLPYKQQKQVALLRGENAIYPDEHSWTPNREQLGEAKKYVAEALDNHSPLLGTEEANAVLFTLVKAEAKAGNAAKAVEMGREILDGKKKLDYRTKANLAVFIADTLHAMGDYKGAVKFYERGIAGSDIGPKNVHKRIAASARAGRDFFRAMQAYSDAIKFCDRVDGKDEIKHLTRLISQMNKSVRKKTSSLDADQIFSDTNEEINELTLDEE